MSSATPIILVINTSLESQFDHQQVIWNRERISNSQDGNRERIKGADTFIFGHTPAVKPLKFCQTRCYLDTGAVFCGNLTLIQVQGEGA